MILPRTPGIAPLAWLVASAALYAVLARAGIAFYSANGVIAIFWPAAGVALAALLLGGTVLWPAVWIGAFAGAVWSGVPASAAAAVASCAAIEPALGAWLLRRDPQFDVSLGSVRSVLRLFLFGAVLSPGLSAAIGAATLAAAGFSGPGDYWRDFARWWMGDGLGIAVVTPLVLIWRQRPRARAARWVEGVAGLCTAFVAGQALILESFGALPEPIGRMPWLALLVAFAAARFGTHGVSIVLLMTTAQTLVAAGAGTGIFADDPVNARLTGVWSESMLTATLGMALATAFAERRRAERALRESEAELRRAQQLAGVGNWSWDFAGDVHRWSEGLCSLFGLDPAQPPPGWPGLRRHLAQSSWPALSDAFDAARRDGVAFERDVELVRADGARRWVVARGEPVRDRRGVIVGLHGTLQDITERKRAGLALAEREARYRAVIETSADGFWMIDERGRLLAVNEAYARRSGYTHDELVTMHIAQLEAQETTREVAAHVEKIRRDGSDRFETWHRTKNGERWPVEINASYWADAGGHFFAFLRDVSERRRAAASMQALKDDMERMTRFQVASQTASAVAHELHQPLNAVAAYAEAALRMLRSGNPQPAKLQHALEASAQQAQRAGRVVRELLALMQQGEVETQPLDLDALVTQVLERIESDGAGDIAYRLDLAQALAPVSANRMQVEKVLINLVENGIEAMRGAGVGDGSIVVRVSTAADDDMAQVTVTDIGPGIDGDTLARIFRPFFTTKPRGLGMGLAISRTIVEAHGGRLWVESAPGAGASFHFTLPFCS